MREAGEPTFGGIAAWARLVGGAWLAVLGLVTLLTNNTAQPWRLLWLVAAVVAWVVVAFFLGRSGRATSNLYVAIDTVLASWAILGPVWTGTQVLFYGGFPLLVVAIATLGGTRRGLLAATVLTVATGYRVFETGADSVADALSQVIGYLLSALIVGRVLAMIHRSNEGRRNAEAATARAEERATMADHLHDSVLQTLALVQREAGDPTRVASIARRQERELRDWLYGTPATEQPGFAEGLQRLAVEIEELHRIKVDVVTVGDAVPSARTEALVSAAREALVNAAKHSQADTVHLYAEANGERVKLYVRDRGVGFDSSLVGEGHGIPRSIISRIEAVGGTVAIESGPGRGTEIRMDVKA